MNEIINEIYSGNDINELQEKKEVINTIKGLCKDDAIDYLLIIIHQKYKIESKEFSKFMMLLAKINNLQSSQLLNRLNFLCQMKLNDSTIHLSDSHQKILDTFDRLNSILIPFDYYHTSGILTYLRTKNPLVRYHHDLDIFINEDNLNGLENSLKNTDFEYKMYLGNREGNTKRRTLKIIDHKNDITISVFIFSRLKDGAIVINDYFYDENGILLFTQDYNTKKCAELSFSNSYYCHNGIPYKSITLEALYNCKKNRGIKHQYDCALLKPFVDFSKEKQIDAEIISSKEVKMVNDPDIENSMCKLLRR